MPWHLRNSNRQRCFTYKVSSTALTSYCRHGVYGLTLRNCHHRSSSGSCDRDGEVLWQRLLLGARASSVAWHVGQYAFNMNCRHELTGGDLRYRYKRETGVKHWRVLNTRGITKPLWYVHLYEIRWCHRTNGKYRSDDGRLDFVAITTHNNCVLVGFLIVPIFIRPHQEP